MISIEIFQTMIYMDLAFILYAFWDNDNRNFTHVYAALISVVLSGTIAYFLMLGLVKQVFEGMTVIQDIAVGYFFVFLGVIMVIYTILSALEAASGAAHPEGVMDE